MYACQQGRESHVRALILDKPECVQTRDRTMKSALHYCAENATPASAELVLATAPELLDAKDDDGFTPLHLAVIAGNVKLVRFLLERGSDLTAADNECHSVVHWATVCGETECLDALLEAGANPSSPDMHGGYPIHYAAQMCGLNSEMGNDVRVGAIVLRILLSHGVDVNVRDEDSRQPILWAASAGSADAVLALVNAGANVEAEDKDGLTALHCAASRGHTECLETLVTLCGAQINVIDSNGCTALFYAVTLGHADCTQLLLSYGAEQNRQDRKGRTAAHCGAAKGQLETLKLLGAAGADLWTRNVRGDFPLHDAVHSGRRELVRWLLAQRPDASSAANSDGRSALHIAAINNNIEMCKVLIDSMCLVNPVMRGSKEQLLTPLDAALLRGYRGCAKYLQLHGGVPASKLTEEAAAIRGPQRAVSEAHVAALEQMTPRPGTTIELTALNSPATTPRGNASPNVITLQLPLSEHATQTSEDVASNTMPFVSRGSNSTERRSSNSSEKRSPKSAEKQLSPGRKLQRGRSTRHPSHASSDSEGTEDDGGAKSRNRSSKRRRSRSARRRGRRKQVKDVQGTINIALENGVDVSENNTVKNQTKITQADNSENRIPEIEETNRKSEDVISETEKKNNEETRVASQETIVTDKALCHAERDSKLNDRMSPETADDVVTRQFLVIDHSLPVESSDPAFRALDSVNSIVAEAPPVESSQDESFDPGLSSEKLEHVISQAATTTSDKESATSEPNAEGAASSLGNKAFKVISDNPCSSGSGNMAFTILSDAEVAIVKQSKQDGKEVQIPRDEPSKKANDRKLKSKIGLTNEAKEMDLKDKEPEVKSVKKDALQKLHKQSSQQQNCTLNSKKKTRRKAEKDGDDKLPVLSKTKTNSKSRGQNDIERDNSRNISARNKSKPKPARAIDAVILEDSVASSESGGSIHKEAPLTAVLKVLSEDTESANKDALQSTQADTPEQQSSVEEQAAADDNSESSTRSKAADSGVILIDANSSRESPTVKRKAVVASDADKGPSRKPASRAGVSERSLDMRVRAYHLDEESKTRELLRTRRDKSVVSVTQAVQISTRKYKLERRIFQELLELKRLQIRAGRSNEQVLVKRAVDEYRRAGLIVGLRQYDGPYSFRAFEQYLYDQLKLLQQGSDSRLVARLKPSDDVESLSAVLRRSMPGPFVDPYHSATFCTMGTHRCKHATDAYTNLPVAAYVNRQSISRSEGFLPRIDAGVRNGRLTATTSGISPSSGLKFVDPNRPVTLELSHGGERQVISLPTERLDRTKRYYVTFTIRPGDGTTTAAKTSKPPAEEEGHQHAQSL